MKPTLTVILPTLNEGGNITALIQTLLCVMPDVQIIVVDDSSTDNTAELVRDIEMQNPQVRLIARQGIPCLTKSIMIGVQESHTDYVGWMDADFSHPPEVMAQLFTLAQSCGCSIATRYASQKALNNKSELQNDSLLAAALSSVLNILIKNVLQIHTTDYTSGFIVCRRDILKDHPFVGDYGEYFIEVLYFIDRMGIKIMELPYQSPPRTSGESKTGTTIFKLMRRGVKYLILTIRLLLPKTLFGPLSLKRTHQ
ncbi:MAG: glycosyltransferase [Desulfobulbaceae bacterium]|nr:glycosyltransferase [Desulfobulbaceae bacterium]